MVTMNDVARRAGVSLSTVSYVLTGARPISEATRKRVLAAMTELDYHPNAMARGLASRRSRILGLSLPMEQRGLGATETAFVTGAAQAAGRADYHLVLSPSLADDPDGLRRLVSERMLDGALLMEVQMRDERVQLLQESGVPFVLIGRTEDTEGLSYVDIDFDRTLRDAVDHLVGLGHRSIVYVNHSEAAIRSGYGPALRTQSAYDEIMRDHGLEPLMIPAGDTAEDGRVAIRDALARRPDLTAVIAMNENALFGILGELGRSGLQVPDHVSVVSIVTSPQVADLATPALTTLTSPGSTLGRIAVETLVRALADQNGDVHQELVACALEPRGSTGPPSTASAATPASGSEPDHTEEKEQ